MALSRVAAGATAVSAAAGLFLYDQVRQNVSETAVPSGSLLADVAVKGGHKDVYIDAFETTVYAPLATTSTSDQREDEAALQLLARSFFSSPAFWPEEKLLQLKGKPMSSSQGSAASASSPAAANASAGGAANLHQLSFQPGDALASGHFMVTHRLPQEVLLEWEVSPSFRGTTWLSVQRPTPFKYQLQLGSAVWGDTYVPEPQSLLYKAHRLYSKVLLYGARSAFERALIEKPSGIAHASQ